MATKKNEMKEILSDNKWHCAVCDLVSQVSTLQSLETLQKRGVNLIML
ncbi:MULTISPECIES: hypothetical protein [Helicobacter]|uniref:Uncharacterized protein n=1 Tax=Helicobacter typhlonius TaxID=76936 RepID=A0A0S4PV88_9HELI|nr:MULTISPECIES: hypothetical protein [Helicobacter]CUU40255.1 Hypothetical protein BN2458_PEG1370 [Helicobacter typhlonius]